MHPGAVVDQVPVQLQGLRAATEPAEADADLVAGGEGVRVVGAEGLGPCLGHFPVGLQRLGPVAQLTERVCDFVPCHERVGVVGTEHPGRAAATSLAIRYESSRRPSLLRLKARLWRQRRVSGWSAPMARSRAASTAVYAWCASK